MTRTTSLIAIALLFGCGGPKAAPPTVDRIARVVDGLEPALVITGEPAARWTLAERMAHYRVPGVSIAVIDSGRIVWARGFGVREAAGGDSVTPTTVFQAGSISKPTFAVAAMRLVQDGRLTLDEDVNGRLTSWKMPSNRFTATEKVTLRRLLSHTAGLTVHGFPGYPAGTPVPTVEQILDGLPPANTEPVRVDTFPGSISRYSGGGTTVAMLLATDVTGRPFPELMRELVLGPSGMTRSSYEQPLAAALSDDAAAGHNARGEVVPGKRNVYPEMSAAGLWTTPTDLARLALELQATFGGRSTRILSKATLDTMFTVQEPKAGAFSLGYEIAGAGNDLEFRHGGADEGFRAEFVAFAARGQGAVIMTNGDNGGELAAEILASVAAEYGWPSHHPREKAARAITPARIDEVVGRYEVEAGRAKPIDAVVSAEGGKVFLEVAAAGVDKVEMLADSDSTFFTRNSDLPIGFTRDRRGRVVAISIAGTPGRRVE